MIHILPVDLSVHQPCDVVLVARADEAHHRDINHGLASELAGAAPPAKAAPYPEHADRIRLVA
jgi:ubiquinol oxidase